MTTFIRAVRPETRSLAILLVPLLLAAGCGLGMDNADRLERAKTAFANNEFRAAIIDTRNILQQEPDNREARLLLGRAALRVSDAATAEKELRRALELGASPGAVIADLGQALLALRKYTQLLEEITPDRAGTDAERLSILRLRGDALMGLDRPADARAVYQQVLAAAPGDLPALLGVASSFTAEEQYDAARQSIDEALAIDASYVPALLDSGSLFLATRDVPAAMAAYEKAVELSGSKPGERERIAALSGLIEAQLRTGDLDAAKATLAQLKATAPATLSVAYVSAQVAYQDQDFELAQAELQKLLSAAPDYQPAQFMMGVVQLQRGNLGQAEMHLSSVVAAAPDNVEARKLLAGIRLRQNRADEAADILRPLVQMPDADLGAINLAVRASLATGDIDNAIGYLTQALENDPDNPDIQLDLATAYLSAGDIRNAEKLLSSAPPGGERVEYRRQFLQVMAPLRREDHKSALADAQAMAERWPEDARVRNLIGGIALALERPEVARASFVKAQQLEPDNVATYLNIAGIDLRQGDLDAAKAQYEAALEHQPDSARLMMGLAQVAARAEQMDTAVEWLEQARTADPAALAPRLLLARVYLDRRDYEKAETMAAEVVGLDATSAEAHNLLGLSQQGQGDTAAALASFSEADRLAPEQSRYRVNKARAELALGETEQAEETLVGNGLGLDDIRSAVMVAALRAKEGNAEAAMKIAKDLQARHPDDAVPYALEAELLATAKQYQSAAAAYGKALSLRPEDPRLAILAYRVRNAGNIEDPARPLMDYLGRRPLDTSVRVVFAQHYQAHGDSDRAIAEYERVLATEPDHFVALNNLAWEYFQNDDPRAEDLARRALEQAPENGSVADTLGWIQVRTGKLEEGIPMLRKAVELTDGNPEVQYHLAAGLTAVGEKAEARAVLEEALGAESGLTSRAEAEQLLGSL
ncbi:MAG TPA: XrtA/PEP-CTERM system TPR-repeat protein PrsT [Woeseiaceae bacterium]|nr:XrtA/PEP-CTERM system TPR-repeat protein PrsT [Woeseiaceae bacterium]